MTTRPTGRPRNLETANQVDKFLAMKPGDSFFVEGAKSRDLYYLKKPVRNAGAGIKIVLMHSDPIYATAGVRVWREAGPYDKKHRS